MSQQLIYDTILWLLVSFHVLGGASLFRRLFPAESPWLAFLVPALAFVVLLNFIEHLVALRVLAWLLPLTLGGLSLSLLRPGVDWTGMRLPAGVFLAAFAFNFAIKCLHPDIPTDDSMSDLNRVLDFSFGDRLPPTDSWLPPFDHRWYYTFQHYAASVVERLFALDLGTAYNLSFTLLNALVCFTGAGVAYLAGGRRIWIVLVAMAGLESGFTGAMPLLQLTMKHFDDGYALDFDAGWRSHDPTPIFQLVRHDPHYSMVLEVPGEWLWHGDYHANLSGFLFMLLAALAALLVLEPTRCSWPWGVLLLIPPLTFLSATWYVPLVALLAGSALVTAWLLGRRPSRLRLVIGAAAGGLLLLAPAVAGLASWPHQMEFGLTAPDAHTPFWIFVIQWWPIYLPWLVLCFCWRSLSAGARWLHLSLGGLFVFVELFNFGGWRWDTIEKMWGGLFGLGVAGLVPLVLARRDFAARTVSLLILLTTVAALGNRLAEARGWIDWEEGFLHLDGTSYLRRDPQKSVMLRILRQLHGQTVLGGVCGWNYTPPAGLVVFSMNRCYVAWTGSEEICGHGPEADKRSAINNRFYAGQMEHPLAFLRDNRINAVLIAPEDTIADPLLARLRAALAPDFEYLDCKAQGPGNAGIFLRRSALGSARG